MLRTQGRKGGPLSPVNVDVAVKYEARNLCLNISSGGLCLLSSHSLPEGIMIDMRFRLPGKEEALTCKARVARCQRSRLGNDLWEVGVKFVELPDEAKMAIAEFVEANTAGSTAS